MSFARSIRRARAASVCAGLAVAACSHEPPPAERPAVELRARTELNVEAYRIRAPELFVVRGPSVGQPRLWLLDQMSDSAIAVSVSSDRELVVTRSNGPQSSLGLTPVASASGEVSLARLFIELADQSLRLTWAPDANSSRVENERHGQPPPGFWIRRVVDPVSGSLVFSLLDRGQVWSAAPEGEKRLRMTLPEDRGVTLFLSDPLLDELWILTRLTRGSPFMRELQPVDTTDARRIARLPIGQDVRSAAMGRGCSGDLFVMIAETKNRRRLFRVEEGSPATMTAEHWTEPSYRLEWFAHDLVAMELPQQDATWFVATDGLQSARITRADADGVLETLLKFDTRVMPLSFAAADFDGDGVLDLATLSIDMTVRVDFGGPEGIFRPGALPPCGGTP